MNTVDFQAEHFINREMSWLEFNARVLQEAQSPETPLLERAKFLSIFSSNLDEFFMIRVSGLREQVFHSGVAQDSNPDGLPAIDQLKLIRHRTLDLIVDQYRCLNDAIWPALGEEGIHIVDAKEAKRSHWLGEFFRQIVYPVITPMAIDPSHPRPRYHNRALYLGARLRRRSGLGPRNLFAVVQVPQVLTRLIRIEDDAIDSRQYRYIFLEDLIASRLPELFGGFDVESCSAFRVTRDSDVDLLEQESDDILQMIEERLKARRRADAVRLEISRDADESFIEMLVTQEQLITERVSETPDYSDIYQIPGPLDLTGLSELQKIQNRDHLFETPIQPQLARGLRRQGEDLFSAIARHDILLHHPFDSFNPVVDFIASAARDPSVMAIKQTLYRTSGDSPIVKALIEAAESGKDVTALVELKARFDEEANVTWARQMERSGVHVVYGFMDLKTHCKIALVVRREDLGVRRYVHLGTGNYNPTTARIYTDLGLFTADEEIGSDVSALFNLLTGYSQGHQWNKLVVAPTDLQSQTIQLIENQERRAAKGKDSRIFAKLNSLVDPRVIEALYRASSAGVPIDLIIRGTCCLRPGIEGVSENIRVRSIVDRFLEHSRILVFGQDESAKVFLSSADWMPRNFYRRVEVMFPIESQPIKRRILNEIIPVYLQDNIKARVLLSDGSYKLVKAKDGAEQVRSQVDLINEHLMQALKKKRSLTTHPDGPTGPPRLTDLARKP